MSSTSHRSGWTALCAFALSACGGGGGGGSAPPPTPDTTAPDTTLSSTPTPRTNLATLPFTATSNEANVTFEARVDNGAFAVVPAVFTLSGLDEGPHSVQLRARDAAGNIDASPATFDFIIDRSPPDTTLVSGPAAGPTTSTSATFTFTSENNASFQASVDGAAFAQVASPLTLTGLGNGEHTVQIRAMDQAANVDATPASVTWTIDIAAPSAQVVFPTRFSYTDATTLRIRGTASDRVAITAVSVGGVAATTSDGYAHWSVPVPIGVGDNTLSVSTTDALGNTTSDAATFVVESRGLTLWNLKNLSLDTTRGRWIGGDVGRGAIVAMDTFSGGTTLVSDSTRGTGPRLDGADFVALVDTANQRILVVRDNTLLEVNPTSGNRTTIPTAATTPDTYYAGGGVACNATCSLIYLSVRDFVAQENGIFSLNPQTGARTLITGGTAGLGSGPALLSVADIVHDAANSRLLVVDESRAALFTVDLNTGARAIVTSTTPSVGTGVELRIPRGVALDAANNRALIVDNPSGTAGRLIAVNLANGERSVIATQAVDADLELATRLFFDAPAGRLLVISKSSNVVQVNLATGATRRFVDTDRGNGSRIQGAGSLLWEAATGTLLTTGSGGIIRIDPATGNRVLVVPTPGHHPGHLNFDTRPGTPPNRLIGLGLGNLNSYDVTAGTSTFISGTVMPGSSTIFPFDAPGSRFIGFSTTPGIQGLVSFSAVTGAEGPQLTDPAIGPLPYAGVYAIGLDDPPAGSRRILGLAFSLLFAANPATGVRSEVSSVTTGVGPTLLQGDALFVNSAGRRAFVSGGNQHSLQSIDLTTGNRSIVSGVNPDDQTITGTGPPITPSNTAIAGDFANDLMYVLSGMNTLLTVDLTTGDRVITSR